MKYEIMHQDAFSIVKCDMMPGESLKAESDAMVAMSGTLDVSASMDDGGIWGGLKRSLAGESFFLQRITAARGAGSVLLAHSALGGINDVALDGSCGLVVQKNGFLAAEETIEIDASMQNLSQGLFSRKGFFLLKLQGKGIVFISSFGAIHELKIDEGEEVIIDNGHLVAWPDYMDYTIEKASSGWLSSFASGEGLVCRFRGPGTVLIQTRKPESFSVWMKGLLKTAIK